MDTSDFDEYIAQEVVKELAGSPNALMNLAGEGDHVHESTKVREKSISQVQSLRIFVDVCHGDGKCSQLHSYR